MALRIKTAEAGQLARSLARLTGERMAAAITAALRERLIREVLGAKPPPLSQRA